MSVSFIYQKRWTIYILLKWGFDPKIYSIVIIRLHRDFCMIPGKRENTFYDLTEYYHHPHRLWSGSFTETTTESHVSWTTWSICASRWWRRYHGCSRSKICWRTTKSKAVRCRIDALLIGKRSVRRISIIISITCCTWSLIVKSCIGILLYLLVLFKTNFTY